MAQLYGVFEELRSAFAGRKLFLNLKTTIVYTFRIINSFFYSTLTGLISAYRGQRSYFECSIGGVATGALAGYFSRNFDALGVHSFTKRTLIFGSRFSPIYCAFVGLLIANAIAIICYSDETVLQQARKWERYWNEYDARVIIKAIGCIH